MGARARASRCTWTAPASGRPRPFYERSHAEIAGLFDSVYVSFYKGLGALAGAALAGDAGLIAEARVWQRRHGGNVVTLHPFVVSAEVALGKPLSRFQAYLEHARALAAALSTVDGIEVVPDPPQTPLFHILLRGERERLADAALSVAEERKVFLFADPGPDHVAQLAAPRSAGRRRHAPARAGRGSRALRGDPRAGGYGFVSRR